MVRSWSWQAVAGEAGGCIGGEGEPVGSVEGAGGRRRVEDRLRSLGWIVSLAPNPATIRATGPGCGVFVSFSGEEPEGVRIRELEPPAPGKRERCLRGDWPGLEALPPPEAAARLLESLDPGEQRRL